MIKHFRTCSTDKPLEEFHKRKASKDGHSSLCKQCQRDRDRVRFSDPVVRAAHNEKCKEYQHGDGKLIAGAAKRRYHKKHEKKRKAHNKVNNAIRYGKLSKGPCEVCGAEKVVGHHDDYDRPLCVRWLCERHHKEWHLVRGEALNPE